MLDIAGFVVAFVSLFLAVFISRKQLASEYKKIPFKAVIVISLSCVALYYFWDYAIDYFPQI